MTRYLRTEMVPLDQLTPFPGNARRGRVDVIKESIEKNGQYRSLVVREVENGPLVVLAGNHTMTAIAELDGSQARCEIIECDDATARRVNLVDNRSNDLAEDDETALADLLRGMDDYAGTGYSPEDVEALVGDLESVLHGDDHIPDDIEVDELVPDAPEKITTQRGDVWTLGGHRLMCGDCRSADDVSALLAGAVVNLAFTSPPYAKQREYDADSEFKPVHPDDYVDWFEPVSLNVADHLAGDGSWFVNIKSTADGLDNQLYVMDLVIAHARRWGWHFATEFCWERVGVPKEVRRRFKNQFEPVYQFTRDDWKIRPEAVQHASDLVPISVGPGAGDTNWKNRQGSSGSLFGGKGGDRPGKMSAVQGSYAGDAYSRTRRKNGVSTSMDAAQGTNAKPGEYIGPGLAYPGNRLPTFSDSHTAAFPVGLPQFFVRAYTDAGDVVYDPFVGSGSTLLACEREGRRGFGMEISPKYCDVTARRYQEVTGTVPLLNGEPCIMTVGDPE